MEALFSTALTFRQVLVQMVENLDAETLDAIPEGFSNNIRWNVAHLVVTPSLLTYKLVGQEAPLISSDFIQSACKGTRPDDLSLNEDFGIKHLCELLIETTKQAQRDFDDLNALDFKNYETSTGFMIKDLSSAIAYSNIHDGIHFGTVRALKNTIDLS